MKIVFFGTPEYVVPILESLHKTFRARSGESPIAAVVTQSPKPVGRKKLTAYSPVDSWAHKKKIPVFYHPQDLIKNQIKSDFGVLADYGRIISKDVINLFPYGILNIHFSLLPKYRGASPVQAAIVSGEKEIGVTIFKIDELLDHGPIISQFKEEIMPSDTWGKLKTRLFERTNGVLVSLIPPYLKGKITLRKQDEKAVSFTALVKKEHGFIPPKYLTQALQGLSLQKQKEWKIPFIKDCSLIPSPSNLERFIRAMDPWPGAWTLLRLSATEGQARRLKILKAHLEPIRINSRAAQEKKLQRSHKKQALPIRIDSHEINEVLLVLDEVQLEGKTPVSWKQFTEGYPNVTFE